MSYSIIFGLLALASTAYSSPGETAHFNEVPLNIENYRLAHGILMSLAFVIFMPIGGIVIRLLLSKKNVIWLHAGWMIFAYILALAGFGIGAWMAYLFGYYGEPHVIIGLTVIGATLFQPLTGQLHHLLYKRTGGRTFTTFLHVWWGRAVITLAIINGGLGLQLVVGYQEHTYKGMIVYGAIAGTIWLVWMGVILFTFIKPADSRQASVDEGLTHGEKKSVEGATLSESGSNGVTNAAVAQ